jgi:hypothetical protein
MAEEVTPKPMPVTSLPDRVDPNDQKDLELKEGVRGNGLILNPGKSPKGVK